MQKTVAQAIATSILTLDHNTATGPTDEWRERWEDYLRDIVKNRLPSGSGFDAGTTIDRDASKPDRLVLLTSYHHMEDGFYTRWTEHKVIVTPCLIYGINVRVTGRDHRQIKDHIAELFTNSLTEEVPSLGEYLTKCQLS